MVAAGDFTSDQHLIQHRIAAVRGALGFGDRVVKGRVVYNTGQRGCLGQRQVLGVDTKIQVRCSLDAVGAVVEVHNVQIRAEDFVLGIFLLQSDGEFYFPDFVSIRFGRTEFDLSVFPPETWASMMALFTYCSVMVEAPCRPHWTVAASARRVLVGSIPP